MRMVHYGWKSARVLLGASFWMAAAQADASVIYTYDQVGRIATALYDNNVCIVYSYDANGNRTSQVINAAGSPNTPTWGTGIFGCFRWSS